jgi:hypothetical protein
LEQILADELKLKDGNFKPDKGFMQKISSRPQLEAEITDL